MTRLQGPQRAPRASSRRSRLLAAGCGRDGQAAAELVALLPLLAMVAAVLWQIALAGHATWAAGAAARAGARAQALGEDPRRAARTRLPPELERGMQVRVGADGSVRVAVQIPALTPKLRLGRASATAALDDQRA